MNTTYNPSRNVVLSDPASIVVEAKVLAPPPKQVKEEKKQIYTQTSAVKLIEQNGGRFIPQKGKDNPTLIKIDHAGIKMLGCIDFLTQKKYGFKRA